MFQLVFFCFHFATVETVMNGFHCQTSANAPLRLAVGSFDAIECRFMMIRRRECIADGTVLAENEDERQTGMP
jgi:hypothetical protein